MVMQKWHNLHACKFHNSTPKTGFWPKTLQIAKVAINVLTTAITTKKNLHKFKNSLSHTGDQIS